MMNEYNLHNLEALFHDFLSTDNVSKVSIKNYLSDIRYFLAWFGHHISNDIEYANQVLGQPVNTMDLFVQKSGPELISCYVEYLLSNDTPYRTINRRLSALRRFYGFATTRGIVDADPTCSIRNVSAPADIPAHRVSQKGSASSDAEQGTKTTEEIELFFVAELGEVSGKVAFNHVNEFITTLSRE
jgi:site-specific recombinase XerD